MAEEDDLAVVDLEHSGAPEGAEETDTGGGLGYFMEGGDVGWGVGRVGEELGVGVEAGCV